MGRPNSGQLVYRADGYIVAIRVTDPITKQRTLRKVTPTLSEAEARAQVGVHAKSVSGETVAEYFERWLGSLIGKRKTIGKARNHFLRMNQWIGHLGVSELGPTDIENVRDRLDALIEQQVLSWKHVANHWTDLKNLFKAACLSKNRALRVRTDDPTMGIPAPERGSRKAKGILFPDEVTLLLGHSLIPREARVLYALLTYSGLRSGELAALEWADVDIPHGFFSITKAWNRETYEIETTKSDAYRRVPIEPNIVPVLEWLRVYPVGEKHNVAWYPTDGRRARVFREHLLEAGITRAELFEDTRTSKALTVHDLRGTHLTWRAIRGESPAIITSVSGHQDFQTTLGYINRAALLGAYAEAVFPAIPETFYEFRETDKRSRNYGQKLSVPKPVPKLPKRRAPRSGQVDEIAVDSSGAEGDRTPEKQPDKTRK